jgi:acyl CoA:acetate/3-ketoacid CoA transferase beta subunit
MSDGSWATTSDELDVEAQVTGPEVDALLLGGEEVHQEGRQDRAALGGGGLMGHGGYTPNG